MEIQVGNIYLTAQGAAGDKTIITIDTASRSPSPPGKDPANKKQFDVDAAELTAAIEALEKTCWRA